MASPSTALNSALDTFADGAYDPSIADALLDRLRHRAVRIELKGESLRRSGPQNGPQLT